MPLETSNLGSSSGSSSVPVGGGLPMIPDSIDKEVDGMSFLRSGFIETDPLKFDTAFFREKINANKVPVVASRHLGPADNMAVSTLGAIAYLTTTYNEEKVGLFLASSQRRVYRTTDDWLTYSQITIPSISTSWGVSHLYEANGFIIAIGNFEHCAISGDGGLTWTYRSWSLGNGNAQIYDITYLNGIYVFKATNASVSVWYTSDLLVGPMIAASNITTSAPVRCTLFQGYYYVSSNTGVIYRTTDFQSYENMSLTALGSIVSFVSNSVCLLAVASSILYRSFDGITWQSLGNALSTTVIKNGDLFWLPFNGSYWVSYEGVRWINTSYLNNNSGTIGKYYIENDRVVQIRNDNTSFTSIYYFSEYEPFITFAGALTAYTEGELTQYVRIK